ncbi:MAG: M14 family metallopeptidase [bacterium]|nr:M14 family metallopeptidase [bacterium]
MQSNFFKRTIIAVFAFAVIGAGIFAYFFFLRGAKAPAPLPVPVAVEDTGPKQQVIGKSVEGRDINVYTYGNGETHLAFVGGVHGGYEWNSVLLAYGFMDYLSKQENIPKHLTISVIPSANPDGVWRVTGKTGRFTEADVSDNPKILSSGRFNARGVDLNRNFDCKWKPQSTWQSKVVSAGSSAFSEPEARAIRDFVLQNKPRAVIFWHSQANAVYASECKKGILPETLAIMKAYSDGSAYRAVSTFDAYEISGDAEGWLASVNIPAITVELKTHETVEWERNMAGIKALFDYYGR